MLCLSSGFGWAQQGIGTVTPNASAALTIESPDKGILIPSISLTASGSFAPLYLPSTANGSPDNSHNGMLVYNTKPDTTTGLSGQVSTTGSEELKATGQNF